eukprot:2066494-Pyramimonas_sp.AAC.1
MLQPNCRATGPPSYYNYQANYNTWKQHHNEDLPYISYCGKIATGPKDTAGDYIKKPTDITSNDEAILKPFERLKCNGKHVHAQPCNKELSLAQKYTRRLQSAFVEAVYLAKSIDNARGDAPARTAHAYPADLPGQTELGEGMRRIGDRVIPK